MVTQTRGREYADNSDTPNKPSSGNSKTVVKVVTALICGLVFGFSIEKGRVFEPSVVINQMRMKQFVMMKMFLSAVIAGMFSMSLLSMIPASRDKFLNARQSLMNKVKGKGYATVMLGGILLGSGMTLAGTCPGVVFAQIGSGTQNAGYTLLGTFAGALLYGILEPVLMSLTKPTKPVKHMFLFHMLGSPYFATALPVAAILSVGVFTLELSFPWDTEILISDDTNNKIWTAVNWQPAITGSLVGVLQIPLMLLIDGVLGASSSYCTVSAQILMTRKLQQKLPYLAKFKSGLNNWWKVWFVIAAIVGAYVSSNLSESYGTVNGVSIPLSFCGGALMIIGARLAGGCTSGHGISGFGLLNVLSIATMVGTFAGGMTTVTLVDMFT